MQGHNEDTPYWNGSRCLSRSSYCYKSRTGTGPSAQRVRQTRRILRITRAKSALISEALHRAGMKAPAFRATTETKRAGLGGRKCVPCFRTAPKTGLEGRSAPRAGDPELPYQDGEQCVARSLVDLSQ